MMSPDDKAAFSACHVLLAQEDAPAPARLLPY